MRRDGPRVRGPLHWLAFAMLLAASTLASAERLYKVEVLVFASPSWFADQGEAAYVRVPDLYDATALGPAPEGASEEGLPLLTELPENLMNLASDRNRLARTAQYQPVKHVAWLQRRGAARKVRVTDERPIDAAAAPLERSAESLASDALAGTALDGFVRLRVGRTLNVDVDLYYRPPGNELASAVRLTESRRVKFNEVHYFDHPGLGALIRVSPVDSEG